MRKKDHALFISLLNKIRVSNIDQSSEEILTHLLPFSTP